jgi:predicted enzyme related to lactoylglutathione lyase
MTNDTEVVTLTCSDLFLRLAELIPDDRTGRISGALAADLIVAPEGPRLDETWPSWFGCVETDDIDSVAGRVWTEGGTIIQPPEDISDVGRFAVVRDPDGIVFLLFQPKTEARDKQDDKRFLRGVPARHKRGGGSGKAWLR